MKGSEAATTIDTETLLADLNDAQRAAVTHGAGPLLIIAGAGTGKTTVITRRIAWLIEHEKLRPEHLLALTFTDKAAGEMEERVDRLLPYGYVELWISTFHAFCEKILRAHALDIGIPADFTLLDTTATWLLIRKNLDRFNLNYYRPLGNPTKFIHALLSHISRVKDELVSSTDYLAYVENLKLNTDVPLATNGATVAGEARVSEIARLEELANAYHVYENILLEERALDFGGLLTRTIELFRTRPHILAKYHDQFKYVLVDEFQDTNIAQYELVKLLAAPKNNLTVVGDDDQCLPAGTLVATPEGSRRIETIKKGDVVLTAVGRGHMARGRVARAMATTKQCRLLRITFEDGTSLTATDNHKMFCYVPPASDEKRFYVYLMESRRFGWRIGITRDLATRLRLERGADRIVGIRSFNNAAEAHYYEMLWMLQYQIPPVCFKERRGVHIRGEMLEKLFKTIDTNVNAKRLANDLHIDLTSHHYALDSVSRGSSRRIKVHFELCVRRRVSKHRRGKILENPEVKHLVSLETSDVEIIQKLTRAGIPMEQVARRIRIRKMGGDIRELERFVNTLVVITGGFAEYSFAVGRQRTQTLKALAMPAKNLIVGHLLPVRMGNEIVYRRITNIEPSEQSRITVHDLEIEKSHNFIANGVVVHNSIYKFRGASLANILEFKQDFPEARTLALTENYRSKQNILDLSHSFIQQNNPNRLEVRLAETGLSKKLKAAKEGLGTIAHLHADAVGGEARLVAETIQALHATTPDISWNDFAVLVRANDHAGMFIRTFDGAGIPYELVTARGLYTEPVILDLVAYARLLDDPHDSPSLYRVLTSPISHLSDIHLAELLQFARKKSRSLIESLRSASLLELAPEAITECQRIIGLIERHAALARRATASQVFLTILEDTDYLKLLASSENEITRHAIRSLDQFYRKVRDFEGNNRETMVRHFLAELNLEIDSGEEGSMDADPDRGPETVKILTCHAAKGLEFKYVFVVNLVSQRFPSNDRSEPIELPDGLVHESLSEGDMHLEEERRLFYVACTRAKEGLYFTSAEDYGGSRKKKLSRFLTELAAVGCIELSMRATPEIIQHVPNAVRTDVVASPFTLPKYVSYSQLKAFETCPLQYKFAHLLHIPVRGRATFSFGQTIHRTLQKFCEVIRERRGVAQASLFPTSPNTILTNMLPVTPEELFTYYDEVWVDDWFESDAQKKSYYTKGKEILKQFYQSALTTPPNPIYLEHAFHLKIGEYTLKGVIDRVDALSDGTLEIIDYKTGVAKTEKTADHDQLYIYQLATAEVLSGKPSRLTYYYVEDDSRVSFLGTSEHLIKLKEEIISQIEEMHRSSFPATPAREKCRHCDFRNICEKRIL